MNVRDYPGFDQLSDHAETHGEVVFEYAEYKKGKK